MLVPKLGKPHPKVGRCAGNDIAAQIHSGCRAMLEPI